MNPKEDFSQEINLKKDNTIALVYFDRYSPIWNFSFFETVRSLPVRSYTIDTHYFVFYCDFGVHVALQRLAPTFTLIDYDNKLKI